MKTPIQPVIQFHIEELVLHGFPAGERHRIAAAMEQELGRLVAAQGLAGVRQSVELERVQGGVMQVVAGQQPQATGVQIARSVFRNLRQQTRAAQRPAGGAKR
jgi:hypothetical protein